MKAMISAFAFACCISTISLFADGTITDKTTGVSFPDTVTVDHGGKQYLLKATGTGTRKKFFVKVYSVASYLQDGVHPGESTADKINAILSDSNAKQLTLKWVHEADAEKVQTGYKEAFKNALSDADFNKFQNEFNQYLKLFDGPIKKGDEHILRWFPGGDIEILVNGNKVGSFHNPEFAKAIWTIWFGTRSVVDINNLTGLLK